MHSQKGVIAKQETKQKRNEMKRDTTEIKQDKVETKQNKTRHNRNEMKPKKSSINLKKTKKTLTKEFFFYTRQQSTKCQWQIEKPLKFTGRFRNGNLNFWSEKILEP